MMIMWSMAEVIGGITNELCLDLQVLTTFFGVNLKEEPKITNLLLILGGGFKYFLCSSLLGEDSNFDYIIFFRWRVETTT